MPTIHRLEVRAVDLHPRSSRPMSRAVRQRMERVFGRDLSAVRIAETDTPSRIGARAFTFGSTVFVRSAADLYDDPAGMRLLGHELTHVLQQRDGRACAARAMGLAILDDAALEWEADRMGEAAACAFESGDFDISRFAARATGGPPSRSVIQCVMELDDFKKQTATSGIRSLDKISSIDDELKAYHLLNSKKPKNYTALSKAAKKLYEAARTFKAQKPDSSRMPGVDRLIKEIVIEDAILSRLAAFEAETDELEKFKILEKVQENFFKQSQRTELNNKTLEGEIFTLLQSFLASASNRGEAFVKRDIEELIAIGKDQNTPALLRSVIAECTAARNVQHLDAANGKPGLKYNTARGATQKYSLSHAMEQSLGKRFRMGSLLHELTHLSIAEIFDNTCLMLAVNTSATDADILALAKSRNAKIQQLIAQMDANVTEFQRMSPMTITQEGVTRNRLYVEFKEKAQYPICGKFANQYLRVFKPKMDPTVHARLLNLSTQGLDCELIEYDTVINQMLLWCHLYDMNTTCGVYTSLQSLVRDAHAYRLRNRALAAPPPARPLPVPPSTPSPRSPRQPTPTVAGRK